MKKIITLLASLSLSFSSIAFAQNSSSDKYKEISKSLVESYNKKDYKNFALFFNKDLTSYLTEDKIKEVITGLRSQFGEIKEIKEINIVDSNTVLYPLVFEKGNLILILTFDQKNKISSILFQPPVTQIKYPEINKTTSIDQIVSPYISQKENMGLAIATIDKDGKSQEYFYGKTAINKAIPNIDTIFEIGSITKVFTTTALAQMILDKKVNLNDDLDKYKSSPSYKGKKIKLSHLATHTSGLPRIPGDLFTGLSDPLNPYANYSKTQMYDYLQNYTLTKEPGTSYDYSNFGMGILGDILANKEKKDYYNFINDTVIQPLGMINTTTKLSRLQIKNSAIGHDTSGAPVIMWDFESMEGAGAIKSNMKDMLKFLKANIYLKDPLLKEAMKLAQTSIYKDKFEEVGMGWNINKVSNDTIIWHNGGTGGFKSFLGFSKKKKTGVVILSNSSGSVDQLASLILKKLSL